MLNGLLSGFACAFFDILEYNFKKKDLNNLNV